MQKLENLSWKPMWVSHLGCIQGCLQFLGLDVSDAWLFGGTGHAFVINMHQVVCPSGPTAWNYEKLFKLGRNLGYVTEGVVGPKSEPDFGEKQKLAWEHVQQAIDRGLPCFGWELDIPEFYVVYGYDHEGYYFSGPDCDEGKGPKPWHELGETEIGFLEMYSVDWGTPADDATTVKEALAFALEHADNPPRWIFPDFKAGLAGYDNWITALRDDKADGFSMAYNAAVWNECRGYAVPFLKEAKARLDGQSGAVFGEAIGHYTVVAQNLQTVADTYPFHGLEPEHIKDPGRQKVALASLKAARGAEASGLEALSRLVSHL
jgi:hypothetical protein